MKRWISIGLTICLMLAGCALAQDGAVKDGEKLPAPEVVAELEGADAPKDAEEAAGDAQADAAVPTEPDGEEAEEIAEAEPTDIPEDAITAEPDLEGFDLWFEEGFGFTLPEGWVSYAVSDADRANGVRYALGDGSGERNLYVQFKSTAIKDIAALADAVRTTDGLNMTGELSFGDTHFVAFIDAGQNASCCATLWHGEIVVFIFTPQTDSDFMLIASRLMESFKKP